MARGPVTGALPFALACLCCAAPLAARPPQETPLGSASAIVAEPAAPSVRVPAGSELLGAPDPRAPSLAVIEVEVELPVLERRGGWVRVQFAGSLGWLPLGAPGAATPARDGSAARPAASPERLGRAREILGAEATARPLGPFTLHTAVDKIVLIDALRRIAAALPAAYAERTGLAPRADSGFAVVLFATRDEYRRFESGEHLSDLELAGHAAGGVAALYLGGRRLTTFLPQAIHELTHLLNRTTLGDRVPAWLEEGLANDLAYCRSDRAGRLELGTLAGDEFSSRERDREVVYQEGPIASLAFLRQRALQHELLPLPLLLDLAWSEFVDPQDRDLRYVESSFLVRYLFDGGGPAGAERFRAYLRRIAGGGGGDPRELLDVLGLDWSALERGFGQWLENHRDARR